MSIEAIGPIKVIEVIEVNRSQSKWLVESIEVDRSDCQINRSQSKLRKNVNLRSTAINFNRLQLASIDYDWYCYLRDRLTTSNYKNPSCWLLWIHHALSFCLLYLHWVPFEFFSSTLIEIFKSKFTDVLEPKTPEPKIRFNNRIFQLTSPESQIEHWNQRRKNKTWARKIAFL